MHQMKLKGWALACILGHPRERYLFYGHFETKREAVKYAAQRWGQTWRELKKAGVRAVKVVMKEEVSDE